MASTTGRGTDGGEDADAEDADGDDSDDDVKDLGVDGDDDASYASCDASEDDYIKMRMVAIIMLASSYLQDVNIFTINNLTISTSSSSPAST